MDLIQNILREVIHSQIADYSNLDEDEIKKRINKYIDSIPGVIDQISLIVKKTLDKNSNSMLREHRNIRKGFEKRHNKLWKKGLNLLETFIVISYEAGEDLNKSFREEAANNNDFVFDTLTRLHARSIQVAYEVLSLLESGFADGAHARWRTIHEISVISLFIKKYGQDIAERYLLHELIESYKAMTQYQKYCEKLNQPPYSIDEINNLKTTRDKLVEKYGKEYCEQYGWANIVLSKNPNFSDLEKESGLEHLRPYYKMASYNVHANPKGIKFKLGLTEEIENILLSGPSNYGLADPAHGTTLSLLQITSALLTHKTNMDHLVVLKILFEYEKEIAKAFEEVNNIMKGKVASAC
ncbi:MAG: hypothetical protein KJ963_06845 [Bacteroidetes bacterium]|nr:hypothetical protein [Bacteroidota bacterium]MBU1421871.1 hypothetical protein [Bacteroidota bacterium]MBU2636784.1 hypothetical protein [Bacteroidota bacterium]